jgi:predicted RNA methylase
MRNYPLYLISTSLKREKERECSHFCFLAIIFNVGTGILSCASALVGAQHIIALDADPVALHQAQQNIQQLDADISTTTDFIQSTLKYAPSSSVTNKTRNQRGRGGKKLANSLKQKVTNSTLKGLKGWDGDSLVVGDDNDDGIPLKSKCVDTVLINPPFGTKGNAGIDIGFLRSGCRLARNVVYSFHKTSTRNFILQKVRKEWNMQCDVVAEMKFDIPATYKFHKVDGSVDVAVDLVRVFVNSTTVTSLTATQLSFPKQERERESDTDHKLREVQGGRM